MSMYDRTNAAPSLGGADVVGRAPFQAHESGDPLADVVGRAPSGVARRMAALKQKMDDAMSLTQAIYSKEREAIEDRMVNQAALKTYLTPMRGGGRGGAQDSDEAQRRRDNIQRATTTISALEPQVAARRAQQAAIAGLHRRCADYLETVARMPLVEHAGRVDLPLKTGGDVSAALQVVRQRIGQLKAEFKKIDNAPYPAAQAKVAARAHIEALAERGRPAIDHLVADGEGEIKFPTATTRALYLGPTNPEQLTLESPDALAVLAWVHKDALIAAVDKEIAEVADDAQALDGQARAKRIAAASADLLEAERQEAGLIEYASAERGIELAHRADIDPRAALGLAATMPPPA